VGGMETISTILFSIILIVWFVVTVINAARPKPEAIPISCPALTDVEDIDIKRILEIEHREWRDQAMQIMVARDAELRGIANSVTWRKDAAVKKATGPMDLNAVRQTIDARVKLREDYAKKEPRLLDDEYLAVLREDVQSYVQRVAPQESKPDFLAYVSLVADKLSLNRKWWIMPTEGKNVQITLQNCSGAVVNVESVIGQIHTNACAVADHQVADAITKLANEIKRSADLGEQRGELLQAVELLTKEAVLPKEKRTMGVVKSLYLGLSSALKLANDMAAAWHAYGPLIAAHFGLNT
jgi:hypothetical protein